MDDAALLEAALDAYGIAARHAQLVQARRNHIYRVADAAGAAYCLRVSPHGPQAQQDLADELCWLAFVAAVRLAFLNWVYNTPNPVVRAEQWAKVGPTFAALAASLREEGGAP
jgi:hypothetical protein